jgi:hypothetical protein
LKPKVRGRVEREGLEVNLRELEGKVKFEMDVPTDGGDGLDVFAEFHLVEDGSFA